MDSEDPGLAPLNGMMLDLRHAALKYLAQGSRVAETVIAVLDAAPSGCHHQAHANGPDPHQSHYESTAMKIPVWADPSVQFSRIGHHSWSVPRLHQLARQLPVLEIPLDHLNIWHKYENLTLREFVMHMRAVQAAELSYPIILDEDGELMDGRHRLMRAMLEGRPTILAVRFDENPPPCRVEAP